MSNTIVSTGKVTTIILPSELKAAVRSEAKDKGVSMAAVVRWALEARYQRQAQDAGLAVVIADEGAGVGSNGDLRRLLQAYLEARVTAEEVADRLVLEEYRQRQAHSAE